VVGIAHDESLAPFFDPRSVAVIGASRDPGKVGGSVLANLTAAGFPGRVVAVNERAATVQGLPAVASLKAVAEPVDLAVIAVPAARVMAELTACAEAGVGGAVVISAGFREAGGEGEAREAELRRWLRDRRLRVLGPNCLGWIRPGKRLNLTFAPGLPRAGSVAFISHSGALAVAILDWSRDRRMGFSLFASLGNQADITECDVLRAAAADPETRVIALYLEGVAEGRRFFEVLRAAAGAKPVVVLKAGRSPEAARAVSSHTGALAGSDRAFEAAVRQAGAVRVRTIEELFDLAHALETQPLPAGRRLVVVTNGGGLGIVATDAARDAALTVPALDRVVQGRLAAVLPPTAAVANPVDLVGDADAGRFAHALDVLRASTPADAALVLLTAQAGTESAGVARAIIAATRGWAIPVAAAFVGGPRLAAGAAALEEAAIPCYPFPERAVAALAGLALVAERRRGRGDDLAPTAGAPGAPLPARAGRHLGMIELQPLLAAYGIHAVPGVAAATPEEAANAAVRIGFPVVVKLRSPDITHKTDVGGVLLGVRSREEVLARSADMLARVRAARPEARVEGVLVQSMLGEGVELLLGAVRDPQFGPLILVGFGGIHVEVLADTAARLAPIGPGEARAMLAELRMAPVLRGVRGAPPVDMQDLAATISRFSRLAADVDALAEVEINPLWAGPKGAIAIDARGAVAGEPEEAS
jgi:acetyltransferase